MIGPLLMVSIWFFNFNNTFHLKGFCIPGQQHKTTLFGFRCGQCVGRGDSAIRLEGGGRDDRFIHGRQDGYGQAVNGLQPLVGLRPALEFARGRLFSRPGKFIRINFPLPKKGRRGNQSSKSYPALNE
jgi:hypothetical protein